MSLKSACNLMLSVLVLITSSSGVAVGFRFTGQAGTSGNDIVIGVMMPFNCTAGLYSSGQSYAGAILLALEEAQKVPDLLVSRNVSYLWNETCCSETSTISLGLYQLGLNSSKPRVHVVIGPACHCSIAASAAAVMRIPMISYMCSEPELSNKTNYPTFSRTVALDSQIIPSLLALLRYFKWRKVAVLFENDKGQMQRLGMRVESTLVEQHYKVLYSSGAQPYFLNHNQTKFINSILKEVKKKARVIILIARFSMNKVLISEAEKLNMTKGDFVFIMLEVDASSLFSRQRFPNILTIDDDTKVPSTRLANAWDSVLLLGSRSYPFKSYGDFMQKLKQRTGEAPFLSSRFKGNGSKTLPPETGAHLYDAIVQYLYSLNSTIAKGLSETDGVAITKHLRNTMYDSVLGYQVHFDENNDVSYNITLVDFRIKNDTLAMEDVADFRYTPNNSEKVRLPIYTMEMIQHRRITWPSNRDLPKDEPDCGFEEICGVDSPIPGANDITTWLIVILVPLSMMLVIVVPSLKYRQHRLERELTKQLWKIDMDDVIIPEVLGSTTTLDSKSENSLVNDYEVKQWFTATALYKSNKVALKAILRKSMTFNRHMLLELKQMRDTRHTNLLPFLGAAVDGYKLVIVSEYGPRGSLHDVLLNKNLKLDPLFILSMLFDITKGMSYLHSSEIHWHGNLKSTNCILDSRWVVKVSDYGLLSLRGPSPLGLDEETYTNCLLYKAPEMLRDDVGLYEGSQKGDVYSFAIIIQECHTRQGPWRPCQFENKDIIRRLRNWERVRPEVSKQIEHAEELYKVMVQCWDDQPNSRPSFYDLKKTMFNLMKKNGATPNILDNMMYMMERYRDHLEDIVDQRTCMLVEEKRKTDALLASMLPPSVLEQLKHGITAEAESFEEVTLYLSDIIGFHNLCALSHPMEVVDFLNHIYTRFDDTIKSFEVYKVETIGDAYMVVSGLPIRNGQRHAEEIALMALNILKACSTLKMPGPSQQPLQLRIGIHTGPVVAGVVGTSMPRYCLFGDTVNTAARMQTSSAADRVHISASTKAILDKTSHYTIETRGEVYLKGKGNVLTYWLVAANSRALRQLRVEDQTPLLIHQGNRSCSPGGPNNSFKHSFRLQNSPRRSEPC